MVESRADLQNVVGRLGLLEDQLQQLQQLVVAQWGEASTSATTDHPYIVRIDGILQNEPIIKGTRTPVRAIVEHWKFGDAPETIARKLPHLRLAHIFDALSYFDDHRAEIEHYIALNRVPVDD